MKADIRELDRYEIREILARGPMSTVYTGWDRTIARKVAIKTLAIPEGDDAEVRERLARFKRGAQVAGSLHHPNIVPVYDYGETSEVAYIVMEFIDGITLKALLDKKRRLPIADIMQLMDEVLAGLAYSHAQGVIHRDIKPANILLTREGRAKITDFGIARIEDSEMTHAGTVMGTPAYMSPEQFRGEAVDQRTDLYSAGVILFQMLTGERPYEGSLATIMHKVLHTEPPRPSSLSPLVSPALDEVVERAMAKRLQDRFASANAFNAALRSAGDSTIVVPARDRISPAAKRDPQPPKLLAHASRNRMPLGIAGLAAIVALVAAGGIWYARSPGAPSLATKPQTAAITAAPPSASEPNSQAGAAPPSPALPPPPAPVVPQNDVPASDATAPQTSPPPPASQGEALTAQPDDAVSLAPAPIPDTSVDQAPQSVPATSTATPAVSRSPLPPRIVKQKAAHLPGPRVGKASPLNAGEIPGPVNEMKKGAPDQEASGSDKGSEKEAKHQTEAAGESSDPAKKFWGTFGPDKNGVMRFVPYAGQDEPLPPLSAAPSADSATRKY